jgi:small-conductance mechanosensitive channel
VVVPNSTVLNEIVTNRSVSDLRKQALLMQTTRGVPSELSRDLTRLVREFDGVAGAPAPSTALESVQDGSVRLRIEFWVPLERGTSVAEQVAEAIRARYPDAALTVM